MNIHVHIERLVLDGLPVAPGRGDLVREAVEAELTRLLAEGGLVPGLTSGGALLLRSRRVNRSRWGG